MIRLCFSLSSARPRWKTRLSQRTVPPHTHLHRPTRRYHRYNPFTLTATGPEEAPTISDVYVLDFDGVLCDSQREVSTAGLASAMLRWPDAFRGIDDERKEHVLRGLAQTRPRLVRGYESMVMARMIWESEENIGKIVASNWESGDESLLSRTLRAWNESEEELTTIFEKYRASRMKDSSDKWIALNPLYPGVAEAVRDCRDPFYICSSKRSDRLYPLLNVLLQLGVEEGSPRIFAGLIPPTERKIDALQQIMSRPVASQPSTSLHFIDDRFETIEAVSNDPTLSARYKLYLAGWGYNTAEERERAATLPGVQVIDLESFCELLRWGIVMQVDDGCQDTEEEATHAVFKSYFDRNEP